MVGETFDKAIVDTGCPHTVAGMVWFKSYADTLSHKDKSSVCMFKSSNKFRFGDGILHNSQYRVVIPIYVNQSKHKLSVDVVNCNIPLLLSRETLKRANAQIDIGSATMRFLGESVPLLISTSGHMCLQIGRPLNMENEETRKVLSRVLFTSPMDGIGLNLKNKARC